MHRHVRQRLNQDQAAAGVREPSYLQHLLRFMKFYSFFSFNGRLALVQLMLLLCLIGSHPVTSVLVVLMIHLVTWNDCIKRSVDSHFLVTHFSCNGNRILPHAYLVVTL